MLERFREHAASLLRNGYQAVGIAIERDGRVLGTVTAGKDPRGRPLANTARFRLASVSKVLLATWDSTVTKFKRLVPHPGTPGATPTRLSYAREIHMA